MEIKDFNALLAPVLNKKIVSYETFDLVGPGENYGSTLLKVDVKVKNDDEEEELLHLVAKMCPPTLFLKHTFNTWVTFKKECGFYNTVIPTLQEFQRERGCEEVIDFVPKYYASRFSLDPKSEEVDDDACLLLENVKVRGYSISDRLTGFDLETAEYLTKELAIFHAVPLALKVVHPQRFEEKVQPYLVKHVVKETLPDEMVTQMIDAVLACMKKKNRHSDCSEYYLDLVKKRLTINFGHHRNLNRDGREPFATVVHNDFWVNNAMIKYENGKPIGSFIVDFQLLSYGSPVNDLIFFIYTSLNNNIITQNYQRLIDLYYKSFVDVLNKLGVDLGPFGYKAFLAEVDAAAKERELFHVLIMLKPILAEREKRKELSEINEDVLYETDLSDLYFERLWFVIKDFGEKGWL